MNVAIALVRYNQILSEITKTHIALILITTIATELEYPLTIALRYLSKTVKDHIHHHSITDFLESCLFDAVICF